MSLEEFRRPSLKVKMAEKIAKEGEEARVKGKKVKKLGKVKIVVKVVKSKKLGKVEKTKTKTKK